MRAVIVPLLLANLVAKMMSVLKPLYNYVDQGLVYIHNYDLPEKLKHNTELHRVRKNKKKLGRSIEERHKEINERNEFGHWECDLVLGHKNKDNEALLTLSERMSREFLIIRIPDKTSVSVTQAFKNSKDNTVNTGMIFLKLLLLIMVQNLQIFPTQKKHPIYWFTMLILTLPVIREQLKDTMVLFTASFSNS